ncbi:hypothetical protein KW795_02035 [Candidatus Microgenomates bacterium]|nr:hypothetical protein [Candidatus Microgenomates bacterium]
MIANMFIWFLLGFIISLLVRTNYEFPTRSTFSGSIFLGAMGAAGGEAMSKLLNYSSNIYISPLIYMMAGSIILIAWSMNNRISN